MSWLFKYIVIFFIIVSGANAFAAENFLPADKPIENQVEETSKTGQIIFDLDETEPEPDLTLEQKIEVLLQTAREFNKEIEGEKLDENFTEELAKYFPDATPKDLYEKQKQVRISMRLYRYFSGLYDDIKAKMLVPEEPPLIVSEEDYDTGYKLEYIEAPQDQFVVVQDFKKVLAYGSNKKDIASITAKRKRDLENKKEKSRMEELWVTLSKVNWKNTLFGTNPVESPFTDKLGSGNWFRGDNVRVRILSEISKIDEKEKITFIFQLRVSNGYFLKASALEDNPYIKIDFSSSKNVRSSQVFYPTPRKIDFGDDSRILAYGGMFSIPFTIEVEDYNKDIELKADMNLELCNANFECKEIMLRPSLVLEKGEGMDSQYNNYVSTVYNNIPKLQNPDIKILSAVATELTNGEKILRITIENDYSISSFDVFAESIDGIELSRPKTAIDGRKIVVRFSLKDQNQEALGKDFLITVVINKIYTLRQIVTASDKSIFDVVTEKLSLPLIFLAVLGGLILNFMPCVFPVLSIKLMSLNKVGARKLDEIKKSFILTILGILVSFFVLALILCFIKYLGYSIGWGMQFQNPIFLIIMIYVIALFIGYIFEFQNFSTPKWLNKLLFKSQDENSILYFLTGVLVVIMATPCTAPYLGTTIGFALAGSYTDIIVILMSVAVGLSLPYAFFAVQPHLSVFVPKPGSWMNKVNNFMVLMLILTFFWLLSIYYAQTNMWSVIRMFGYAFLFLFILWIRHLVMAEIDTSIKSKEDRYTLRRKFNIIALVLIALIFSGSVFDGVYNFTKKKEEILQIRENKIDMEQINKYINEGKIVVVNVQADWCLTCMYNELTVFSNVYVERLMEKENIEVINVDWTNYNKDVLNFMEKYGRKGLPFYVIYSKNVPDGMVLPEILNDIEFAKIVKSITD